MTAVLDDGLVRGLLEERRGYIVNGKPDRAAEVDAELAKVGVAVNEDGTVDGLTDPTVEVTAELEEDDVPKTAEADRSGVRTATRPSPKPKTKP